MKQHNWNEIAYESESYYSFFGYLMKKKPFNFLDCWGTFKNNKTK